MPFSFNLQDEAVRAILYSLVTLLVLGILARLAQRLVIRYIEDPERRYRSIRISRRVISLVGLVLLAIIWSPGEKNIITVLTVIGAGLAIAMREALLSIIGWMNLAIRAPFKQGDRIEVNGIRGDVLDIRLLHSTLMEIGGWVDSDQSTGRLVHVPNSWVFQHAVYNYTRGFGFIWNELAVTVTFRSDWVAARQIMLSMAQESAAIVEQQAAREIRQMSREYLLHYSILTPFVYVKLVPSGVRLTLRYLCEARKRRGTEHAFTVSVLQAFQEHGGIELAYPMVGVTAFDTPQFGSLPTLGAAASSNASGERRP